MTLPRIPALALALATVAVPGAAQTRNPLDPALPLTVHAVVSCVNVVVSGDADASCTRTVSADSAVTPNSAFGSGTASADLSSGLLRVISTSQTYRWNGDALAKGGSANAFLYDTLTFAGLIGDMQITMHMTVDGSFVTTDANPNSQGSDVRALLFVSRPSALPIASGIHIHEGNAGDVYLPSPPEGTVTTNADPLTTIFPRSDVRFDLATIVYISQTKPSFTFLAQLRSSSFLGFTDPSPDPKNEVVDFGNTARLSIDLPPGVSFTSSSGLFLTGVATPIPEPETAWLLLAGILPLAARLRWTRRAGGRGDEARRGAGERARPERYTTVCASSPCA